MTPAEAPEFETPPEPKPMNELTRLVGVFVNPGATFKDIAARPRWWVPLVLTMLVVTAYLYLFTEQIGWTSFIRRQLDQSTNNMSAEQRQQTLMLYERFGPLIAIASGLVQPILVALVVAFVLKMLADVVMGANVGFKRTMAAVTYGMMPTNVVGVLLATIVMQFKPKEEFDLQNPLAFNLGAFLAANTPPWMQTAAASIDLFSFWSMLLIAMGLSAASRKLSTGKAFSMILFPWALMVILRVGAVAAFRR